MNEKEYYEILSGYIRLNKGKEEKFKKKTEIELEIRFEFDFQISEILDKIRILQKYEIYKEESIVEDHGRNQRKIIYLYPEKKEIPQIKINIKKDDFNIQGFPFRISYSREINETIVLIENPTKRYRERYIIKNFFDSELHLTIVTDDKGNIENKIEIEYSLDKIRNVEDIIEPIKYLFDLLYVKSIELLTSIEINPIIDEFNYQLEKLKGNITKTDENNKRNGMLIGYEDKPISILRSDIKKVKSDNYYVTNKLNGTRYYLYIRYGVFYLIGKTGSKITNIKTFVWKIFELKNNKDICILDGEYFNNGKSNILYYSFDILLATQFNKLIHLKEYQSRLGYLKQITDFYSKISVPIQMKQIEFGKNTYKIVDYMKSNFKEEWDYENDGLIYTPAKAIYADKSTPTLKWKFDHHQSVDVLVKKYTISSSEIKSKTKENIETKGNIEIKEFKDTDGKLKSIFFRNYDVYNQSITLDDIKMTDETVYSISHWKEADFISDNIIKNLNILPENIVITDATANVGGNTISFYNKNFKRVNSVEIDSLTCDFLKNNLNVYKYGVENVYCKDYLDVYMDLVQDCVFFDPPWGGPSYIKQKNISLYLGTMNIKDVIRKLLDNNKAKLIVLKVPVNYNFEELRNYLFNYKMDIVNVYRDKNGVNKNVYDVIFINGRSNDKNNENYYKCFISDQNNSYKRFTEYLLYSPEKLVENSIIEVSFDTKNKFFYMLRSRPDKKTPNFINAAEDFWKDIINPIPITDLSRKKLIVDNKENDWKEYRKYSNLQKKDLIEKNISSTNIILDIGFGKAADLLKYASQGVKNIIAVEPDKKNIEDFLNVRYKGKYRIINTLHNSNILVVTVDNKYEVEILLVNKSGSDKDIIPIINEYLKKFDKIELIATMFFSLTYFFGPDDGFVKMFSILMEFNPVKILGTFMDGEKTKNFLRVYEWNENECGLDLKLSGDNDVYIKIDDSATVSGHHEYLCDFSRLENFLNYYQYKSLPREFFKFTNNKGTNNLLPHFASLNCSFVFEKTIKPDVSLNNLINNIVKYNENLELRLDASYFYKCLNQFKHNFNLKVINDTIFDGIFKNQLIYSNKITYNDNGIYKIKKGNYKGYEISKIDDLRFYYMTGRPGYNFILTYEVPLNSTLSKKIFYDSTLPYKITNTAYDYYFNKDKNDAYELLNILNQNISELKKHSMHEYNIGVGNYTIMFASLFKSILCLEENLLNIELASYNMELYNNYKINNINDESFYFGSKTLIKPEYKHIRIINHFIDYNSTASILFVNYISNKNFPELYDLNRLKNWEFIVILTENIINNITKYFPKFKFYKLTNSYVYIIKKNKGMFYLSGEKIIILENINIKAEISESGNLEPYPVKYFENGKWHRINLLQDDFKKIDDVFKRELNPHCEQVYIDVNGPEYVYEGSLINIPFRRFLNHSIAPRLEYKQRAENYKKTVIHNGQRKLLMSEIEFLNMYTDSDDGEQTVVYAGAAPGTHIGFLSTLFPYVKFYLYDPAPFNDSLSRYKNIVTKQTFFTNEVAEEFKDTNCLFICDIRRADEKRLTDEEIDKQIKKDMEDQMEWHEIMKPKASMLKFRLSWKKGLTRYLSGKIYLPVWGRATTTETRLIVDKNDKVDVYDNTIYEQEMFYFNSVTRVAKYKHGIVMDGIDHCYDCSSEIHIWKEYLEKRKTYENENSLNIEIIEKIKEAENLLNRKLSQGNIDTEKQRKNIEKKQFIHGKPAYITSKGNKEENKEENKEIGVLLDREETKSFNFKDEDIADVLNEINKS